MQVRAWVVALVAVVCAGLGVLIAGLPGDESDRPLAVRLGSRRATTTTTPVTTSTITTTTATTTTVAPQPRAPGDVSVGAANASATSLAATHMTSRIAALGYRTLPPLNSNRTDLQTTVVTFAPSFEVEAGVLARTLGATQVVASNPTFSCDPRPCTGDIVVFVGKDLAT